MRRSAYLVGVPVLLGVLMTPASCGYRLSGTGDVVPAGASAIAIPVAVNSTSEPHLDVYLTRAVTEEFLADGRLRVVDLENADLALRCRIAAFQVTAQSYTPESFVQQYRVRVVVDARLEDLKTRRVLWEEAGIDSDLISDYPVSYDGTAVNVERTKLNRQAAIEKASRELAQTLRARVLEGF